MAMIFKPQCDEAAILIDLAKPGRHFSDNACRDFAERRTPKAVPAPSGWKPRSRYDDRR
jgi:hypothetical protein